MTFLHQSPVMGEECMACALAMAHLRLCQFDIVVLRVVVRAEAVPQSIVRPSIDGRSFLEHASVPTKRFRGDGTAFLSEEL